MSEDKELKAMGTVLSAMEGLEVDEKKRVINWLAQKMGLNIPSAKAVSPIVPPSVNGTFDHSTDTIATLTEARSGPNLVIAAAAHFHFVKGQQRFTRQELVSEMRSAPAHFKDSFTNNMSTYLRTLTKADRLRLVSSNTYALSSKERQALEAKLANPG